MRVGARAGRAPRALAANRARRPRWLLVLAVLVPGQEKDFGKSYIVKVQAKTRFSTSFKKADFDKEQSAHAEAIRVMKSYASHSEQVHNDMPAFSDAPQAAAPDGGGQGPVRQGVPPIPWPQPDQSPDTRHTEDSQGGQGNQPGGSGTPGGADPNATTGQVAGPAFNPGGGLPGPGGLGPGGTADSLRTGSGYPGSGGPGGFGGGFGGTGGGGAGGPGVRGGVGPGAEFGQNG